MLSQKVRVFYSNVHYRTTKAGLGPKCQSLKNSSGAWLMKWKITRVKKHFITVSGYEKHEYLNENYSIFKKMRDIWYGQNPLSNRANSLRNAS